MPVLVLVIIPSAHVVFGSLCVLRCIWWGHEGADGEGSGCAVLYVLNSLFVRSSFPSAEGFSRGCQLDWWLLLC